MARPRQPIDLVVARGQSHKTKAEIQERRSREVRPVADGITAPSFLTVSQKKTFDRLAGQLSALGIMGETDCEALGRYIVAQDFYAQAVADLREMEGQRPEPLDGEQLDVELVAAWAAALEKLDKRVDRYFKQATTAASKLGLTISDRCRLAAPVPTEPLKPNKFAEFLG